MAKFLTKRELRTSVRKVASADGYRALVRKIAQELAEIDFFVKRKTAEGYWTIGKYIHEYILVHEKRAEYGETLYQHLAEDVDRDKTTLRRAVQFYRTYSIRAIPRELTWEHYRNLITVKDEKERKNLEQKVIRGDWNSTKLREYLSTKRELAEAKRDDKPIPQLTFTRGRLDVCPLKISKLTEELSLDLGFRLMRAFPDGAPADLKEGDCVTVDRKTLDWTWQKVGTGLPVLERLEDGPGKPVPTDELFTYEAKVVKVVDGDTLVIYLDVGLGFSFEQRLRLRGIDCPELDTEEGQRARRFVQARLNPCDFIIVKTFKQTVDIHDRYIVDVFYLEGESDPHKVAQEGTYLNQELLNEGLALAYE